MAVRRISGFAPAKLNLSLKVGAKVGALHEINSVMTFVTFADRVTVVRRDDGKLRRCWKHPQVSGKNDLAMRAALLFQQASGTTFGADIAVDKKIPIGGGLGGGSSNAATVLMLLNELWAAGWSRRRLMNLASKLGSDMPFFIYGRAARVTGTGEKLRAVQLPPKHYLLVFPKAVASSGAVYAEYDKQRATQDIIGNTNDLAAAALSLYPAIGKSARQLRKVTEQVCLSGSGACVYADFPTAAAARKAQKQLSASYNTAVAAALPEHPLYRKLFRAADSARKGSKTHS